MTLVSLLARAAVPPFDWKNLVADSLPPTFMVRSCSHCQTTYVSVVVMDGLTRRTVEIGRPDKGDVDAQITMVGGAVKTQIDAEWYGRPCWVLLAAIEADLGVLELSSLEQEGSGGLY